MGLIFVWILVAQADDVRITMTPAAAEAAADEALPVPVSLLVTSAGSPRAGRPPALDVDVGRVGPVVDHGDGTYSSAYYPAPGVAATLVARLDGARAEAVVRLRPAASLKADPPGPVIGETEVAVVTFTTDAPYDRLSVAASIGSAGPIRIEPRPDAYSFDYVLPLRRYPQVAILTVLDDGRPIGRLALPLRARTELILRSEPGARIEASLGERSLPPVQAGSDGRATLQFDLNPEESLRPLTVVSIDAAGNRTEQTVDLAVPADDVFSIVAEPAVLLSGSQPYALVRIRLLGKDGRPRPAIVPTLTSDRGRLTPPVDHADGTYTAFLLAEGRVDPGPIRVTARADIDGRPMTASTQVQVVLGPPARVEIDAPSRAAADPTQPVVLTLRLFDGAGLPLAGVPMELLVSSGSVESIVDNGDGTYRVRYIPPAASAAGSIGFLLRVQTGAAPGEPEALAVTRVEGGVAVLVRDAQGRPVGGVPVRLEWTGPDARAMDLVTDAGGRAFVSMDDTGDPALRWVDATIRGGERRSVLMARSVSIPRLAAFAPLPAALLTEHVYEMRLVPPELMDSEFVLEARPLTLRPDGAATAALTVYAPSGRQIFLSATIGEVSAAVDRGDGSYTATFTAPRLDREDRALITATEAERQSNTVTIHLTAGTDVAEMELRVSPDRIQADPAASFDAIVELRTAAGSPVEDGTSVEFSFAGSRRTGATVGGRAAVRFSAAAAAGAHEVRAQVGSLTRTATVTLTSGAAATVALEVTPASVEVGGDFTATATVRGADGTPVADGTSVSFTVASASASASTVGGRAAVTLTAPAAGQLTVVAVAGSARGEAPLQVSGGAPASLSLSASPDTIPDDGGPVRLTAVVSDGAEPVPDGTPVEFTLGAQQQTQSTSGGRATATFIAPSTPGTLQARATAGSASGQATVTVTSGPAAALEVSLSSTQVRVNERSTVTVTARDAHGHPVADGTSIQLTAVLGSLPASVTTNGGSATATFAAGASPGNGSVTATVGGVSASKAITVLAAVPNEIVVTASPDTLVLGSADESTIEARVRDAFGNLVEGEQIDFTVSPAVGAGTVTPVIRITDSNGLARVVYRPGTIIGPYTIAARSRTRPEVRGTVTVNQVSAASRVVVKDAVEPAPGDGNAVVLTVEVQDVSGQPEPLHANFTATIVLTGSATTTDTVVIPNGVSSTTVTIRDTAAEIVTVSLSETSATPLVEASGRAAFIPGPATRARVIGASEPAPGDGNSVVVTVEILDADGNRQPSHALYQATVSATGSAAVAGNPLTIPDGAATGSITVTDTTAETVTVSPAELTATPIAEIAGTATFMAGKAVRVRLVSAAESAPGTSNAVTLTARVEDNDGNLQSAHASFAATLSLTGTATTASTVNLPTGSALTTVTINDLRGEAVSVGMVEATATGLARVGATATFIPGTAARVVVIGTAEPSPYTSETANVTIEVRDADGNAQASHPTYTANLAVGGSAAVQPSVTIADGVASATVAVEDTAEETVALTLFETSATSLAEVNGTVRFHHSPIAVQVVAVPATEAAPGSGNSVTMTFEVRDAAGVARTDHPTYAANLYVSGSAAIGGGATLTIPAGVASVTKTITDAVAETVTVTLQETSATPLAEVNGTATFIPGAATRVVVVSTMEANPGTANSAVVRIEVRDADGNPQGSHAAYTATVAADGGATVTGSPISIPDGTSSTPITVDKVGAATINVMLTETSGTTLAEVNGTVRFIGTTAAGNPGTQVVVIAGTEGAPGTSNRVTLTVEVRDANGVATTEHPDYQARVLTTGYATGPATLTIPSGSSSATIDIDDVKAETVTVSLEEITGTNLVEASGTATFIGGTATNVIVRDNTEEGNSNKVVMTIVVADADGNPQSTHPAYAATVNVPAGFTLTGSPVTIPDGTASVTATVNGPNSAGTAAVTLTESSTTVLTEVGGTAFFTDPGPGKATRAVVVSGTEPAPGTANQVVLTIETRRSNGNPSGDHSEFRANVLYSGHATGPASITIPAGTSSTTITIDDDFAEAVTVTLDETSGTLLDEVAGTATFIAGTASRAVVRSATEPAPGNSNRVNTIVEAQDADGNPQPNHGDYTATLASPSANVTGVTSPISIPAGIASVAIVIDNNGATEAAVVRLTETSGTSLQEVDGTATFLADTSGAGAVASSVVVVSATEAAPGTSNQVVLAVEVRDQFNLPIAGHVDYAARVFVDGFASAGGATIMIANGSSSATVTVDDVFVETVNVTLQETSSTNLTEVAGTATFTAGTAVRVKPVDRAEAAPGTSDSVAMTIQVQDADGNPQAAHADYTATLTDSSATATVVGGPISIPAGVSDATIVVNDAVAEDVTITPTETSGTGLAEVTGVARFLAGPASRVAVVSGVEPAPGTADSLTITVEVRDASGNLVAVHPTFSASALVTGSASVVGSPFTIADGVPTATLIVNDASAETVALTLSETTDTGMTTTGGTATFIAGTAAQVVVQSAVEPAPGTADSVSIRIDVRDANGNAQSAHPAYTASLNLGASSATALPAAIAIPDGTAFVTVTINDAEAETVTVTLAETSATPLTEVNGTVRFIDDPPVAILQASPVALLAGGAVRFDGSASYALDPFVVREYLWDFNGDGIVDSRLAAPPAVVFPAAGVYRARLTVNDTGGYTDTVSIDVYVGNPGDPTGPIVLNASALEIPADGVSEIDFTSGILADGSGAVVPDGTRVTIFTPLGAFVGAADAGPEPGLQVATSGGTITFRLQADVVAGNALVTAEAVSGTARGARAVRFRGGSNPPFVVDASPSGAATEASSIDVIFNKDIQPGSLNASTFAVTDAAGRPVAGSLGYLPATRTATFVPAAALDPATQIYSVALGASIVDPDGNALIPFSFSFGAVEDRTPPELPAVTAAPDPFSPDGDGVEDASRFIAFSADVARWRVRIGDVRTMMVEGPSLDVAWDGRDESGLIVEAGLYEFEVTGWDAAGNGSIPVRGGLESTSPIQVIEFGP